MRRINSMVSVALRTAAITLIFMMILATVVMLPNRRDFVRMVTVDFIKDVSSGYERITIPKGSIVENPPVPEKEGYVFVGWYKDKELSTSFDISLPIEKDIRLYAGFFSLGSEDNGERDTVFLSFVSKDTVFSLESSLSKEELEKKISLSDDLTGETVLPEVVENGKVFSVSGEFKEGHTYTFAVPEEAKLSGSPAVKKISFTVAAVPENAIEFTGNVIEIPESCPSAERTLQLYTASDVKAGDAVLAGGNDKHIFIVREVIDGEKGKCLLLEKAGTDFLKSINAGGVYSVSLSNKSFTLKENAKYSSFDEAKKLSDILFGESAEIFESGANKNVLKEENGLKITVSSVDESPLGSVSDLLEVLYEVPVNVGGEEATLKFEAKMLVSLTLSLFFDKEENGKLLSDVSVNTTHISESIVTLLSKDGKPIVFNEEEYFAENPTNDAVDMISDCIKNLISERITASLPNFGAVLGEVGADFKTSFNLNLDISSVGADIVERRAVSETFGIRGFAGNLETYSRMNSSSGYATGNFAGKSSTDFGLSFEISVNVEKLDHSSDRLSASIGEGVDYFGVFSVSLDGKNTKEEGLACLTLSSKCFVFPEDKIERGTNKKECVLEIGKGYLTPANQKFEKNEYSISGDFFVPHILSEGLTYIFESGNVFRNSVLKEDVVLHFSGPLAEYIKYDGETGWATFEPHEEFSDNRITLEIYYKGFGEKRNGETLPIKRTVTLTLGEKSDMENRFPENESFTYLAAFLYFENGKWNVSYENRTRGNVKVNTFTDETGWIAIYPKLGNVEEHGTEKIQVNPTLVLGGCKVSELPKNTSGETLKAALNLTDVRTDVIFIADYKDKSFDVTYISGSEQKSVSYDKNALRGGVLSVVNSEKPASAFEKVFGGWKEVSYADESASYSLEYAPASFTVTVLNSDGSVNREELAFVGELPEFLKTPPREGDSVGVWLSSEYSGFVGWLDYPEFASIEKDITVTPYFGKVVSVTVDSNGGTAVEGTLYPVLKIASGEFDFDAFLPVMQKAPDVVNSYSFTGWGKRAFTEDGILAAPFAETRHVYTLILNAKRGEINGKKQLEFTADYMGIDGLIEKMLEKYIPIAESTESHSYTFKRWKKGTGANKFTYVYNAEYTESSRLYNITLIAPEGGIFPNGENTIVFAAEYNSKIDGLSSPEYYAKIPGDGEKVKVIDYFLLGEKKVTLDSSLTVKEDITLTAVYKEIDNRKFTVTFDAGDGKFGNGKSTLVFEGRIGDPVPKPSDPISPTGPGFTSVFLGWDKDIPDVFTEDLVLKADYKIEKKIFTVTYYTVGSDIYAVYKVAYGDEIPVPKNPDLPGYDFIKWEGIPADGKMGAGNVDIYAKLDKATYTVNYVVDGEIYETEELYLGEKIMKHYLAYKPGYVFSGWTYPAYTKMPDHDITVTGSFSVAKYSVTYIFEDKIYKRVDAKVGENVKLIGLPSGAKMWCSSDVKLGESGFTMPAYPVKIYTHNSSDTFILTFEIDGKTVETKKYTFGSKVELPEIPKDERFTGKWLFRYSDEYREYEKKLDKEDFEPLTRVVIKRGDIDFGGYMPAANIVAVPELKIENILSGKDINQNGTDDFIDIVKTAKDYTMSFPVYESIYYHWNDGYPDDWHGVCTDVIWRAYLGIGVKFKDLVDSDIAYGMTLGDNNPYLGVVTKANPLIDFRRVRNLKIYYDNNATVLTKDTLDPTEWQPGDIVVFSPSHIGICSDKRDSEGLPLVIHHTESRGAIESDELGRYTIGNYTVTGHYRIDHDRLK